MKQKIEQLVRQGDGAALPMQENDAGASTIGEYLKTLLLTLWREGEGFSGKRPFGNSGWDYDLYAALIKGGIAVGKLDEDGYVDEVDYKKANEAIEQIIESIFALSALREQDEEIAKLRGQASTDGDSEFDGHSIDDAGLEIERLEKDNARLRAELARAVVLPCKPGSAVYAWSSYGNRVAEYRVSNIFISETATQVRACWMSHSECEEEIDFTPDDFGKTVFLTRDQAEAAMQQDAKEKEGGWE